MERISIEDLEKVKAYGKTPVKEPQMSELKVIYSKLEYICESLPKDTFYYRIRKDPRNQGGGFKNFQEYLWAKIYPIEFKDSVINKLAIIIGISNGTIQFHIMGIGIYQSNEASLNASKISWEEIDARDLSYQTIVNKFENFYRKNRDLFIKTMNNLELHNLSLESNVELKENFFMPKTQNKNNFLNQILYGPPGTGKTYSTINKALSIIENKSIESLNLEDRADLKLRYKKYVDNDQIVFTTFHQSMSYEDFVEGIKPLKPLSDDTYVKYEVTNGIFKTICKSAETNIELTKSINKTKRPFDEVLEQLKLEWEENINLKFPLKTIGYDYTITGFTNTSIQFKKASGGTGHTLSLKTLEELYYGKEYEFKAGVGIYYPAILQKLNSFNENFVRVDEEEKNYILIIDEINRGNVSAIFGELITLIEDSKREGKPEALSVILPYSKEKFSVPSNLYIIGTMNTADRSVEALDTALRRRFVFEEMLPQPNILNQQLFGYHASDILEKINKRIEKLIDRDHCIGHAYFLHKNEETIIESFYKNIIPLLQEYFFGDYGKIGLVLGKGFVDIKPKEDSVFAEFIYDYVGDLESKPIYKIIDYRVHPKEGLTFADAIQVLMK